MRLWTFVAALLCTSCIHTYSEKTVPSSVHRNIAQAPKAPPPGFVDILEVDPRKKTVCGITLNSDNELLAFQDKLSKENFQFVELYSGSPYWLRDAGIAKIKCDILVISGHFGGQFFGTRGSVSLEELENHSCDAANSGIFHAPKEVFLFGCNTLAGKSQDRRTPEEYRRVLIEDDFSEAQADLIVSLRYSPIGQTFHDRMSRVFAGVPKIYGFHSIAPSGKNVEPLLKNYLKSTKNYSSRLTGNETSKNTDLFKALKDTAIAQTMGKPGTSKSAVSRCYLNAKDIPESEKIDWIYNTLKNPSERAAHLAEISSYLIKGSRHSSSRFSDEKKLTEISKDKKLAQDMNMVVKEGLKDYPFIRLSLINISRYFGWVSMKEAQKISHETLGRFFDKSYTMTLDDKDYICSNAEFTSGLLTYDFIKNANLSEMSLKAISCMKPTDTQVQRHILGLTTSADPEVAWAALEVLEKSPPKDHAIQRTILSMAKDPSNNLAGMLLGVLGNAGPDLDITRDIVGILLNEKYEEIVTHASGALARIETPDQVIQAQLIEAARSHRNPKIRIAAIEAIAYATRNNPEVKKMLFDLVADPDSKVRLKTVSTLGQSSPGTPDVMKVLIDVQNKDREFEVMQMALNSLGKAYSNNLEFNKVVLKNLTTNDENRVFATVTAIMQQGTTDPAIEKALISLVKKSPQDITRTRAFYALRQKSSKHPEFAPLTLTLLKKDTQINLLINALEAAREIAPPGEAFVKALASLLTHEERMMGWRAAQVLGQIKPNDPKIKKALREFNIIY